VDALRFSRAGSLLQGLVCIFGIDSGWAGAIVSRLAPTGGLGGGWDLGLASRFSGLFRIWVRVKGFRFVAEWIGGSAP